VKLILEDKMSQQKARLSAFIYNIFVGARHAPANKLSLQTVCHREGTVGMNNYMLLEYVNCLRFH
jgi:hypothetical protein